VAKASDNEAKAPEKEIPPPTAPAKGGRKRRKKKKKGDPKQLGAGEKPDDKALPQKKQKAKAPAGVVREPRSGAVLVTADPAKGITMPGALQAVRPAAMEFLADKEYRLSLKRAQAGGLLIQISGEDGHRLADELAVRMREAASKVPGVGGSR